MSKPSTRNPQLPTPARLEQLFRSLATLDAILCREWQDRYYSFNKDWDALTGNRMGSMRNGCGDDFFILFVGASAAIKGYAHEYPMANPGHPPKGVLDTFPTVIENFLTEPAFVFPEGSDPDGSEFLLELLTDAPQDYQAYASEYYEVEVPLASIRSIYAHEPLTEALVRSINAETNLADLAEDLAEIGYPVEGF